MFGAVVLAILAAFLFAVGATLQQREAVRQPVGSVLDPRLLVRLARRPRWVLGVAADGLSAALHVVALSLGSVALVQPLGVTGLLFAVPLAALQRRRRIARRDVAAAAIVLAGLVGFLLGVPVTESSTVPRGVLPVVAVIGGVVGIGAVALALAHRFRGQTQALILAAAAGACFGVTATLVRVFLHDVTHAATTGVAASSAVGAVALAVLGYWLQQNAYRAGHFAASLATASVVDPLAAIAAAIPLLGEFIPRGPTQVVLAMLCLTVVALGVAILVTSPAELFPTSTPADSDAKDPPAKLICAEREAAAVEARSYSREVAGPEWDVIVVGAGPAGCAAAAAAVIARPGARILLLDQAEFPRDKVCGDGIAAAALEQLSAVGVSTAALIAGFPQIDRLILRSPRGVVADRRAGSPSWVVPREVFDARLRDAVLDRGVIGVRHRVRRVSQQGDEVGVDGRFRARTVVIAAGADTVLTRAADGGKRVAMAIGIRGYARTTLHDAQALCLSDQGWPAYAWSFPIGDGWANVGYGAMVSRHHKISRHELRAQLDALTPGLLSSPERLRAHRLPLAMKRPVLGRGRVLQAGDAAGQVNPLSGEGIFYAVRTGAAAGTAAVTDQPLDNYRRAVAVGHRHRRHAATLTAAIRRVPRLLEAGVAAAADDQRAFDDLVTLALEDGVVTGRLLRAVLPRLPVTWNGRPQEQSPPT